MKKIGSLLAFLCLLNVLMLAGIVGYLCATGRLDRPKAQAIGDLLRQPGSPPGLRAKLYDIMTPAAQTRPTTALAPATSPAPAPGDTPALAQERIDYVKKIIEEERLNLDAEAQKLQHQQDLLVEKERQIQNLLTQLEIQQKAYDQSLAAAATQADAAGFQKTMSLFDELKPKQVKDLLASMPPGEVARYVTAMEPDRAAQIIAEFKTTDEKQLINAVLDKVRGAKDPSGTGAASGPPAASPPVAAVAGKAGL